MCVAGLFILPVISVGLALINLDKGSILFWWNFIFFANSLALAITIEIKTLKKILNYAKNPDEVDKIFEHKPPSTIVKECPTRNFKTGGDIYSFCFFLCQKKKIIRTSGIAILESEVPSSFQAHQVFLTMVFCGIS
jgi:hypothetical protein